MGIRGSKYSSIFQTSSTASTFNIKKLLLSILLVILISVISGCDDTIDLNLFPQCGEVTELTPSGYSSEYLCVPQNYQENEVCLRTANGDTDSREVKGTINQMYANAAADLYFSSPLLESTISADDVLDSFAIMADTFFGNGIITHQGSHLDYGSGFYDDQNRWEAEAHNEGGTADSGCVVERRIYLNDLDYQNTNTPDMAFESYYGLDDGDVGDTGDGQDDIGLLTSNGAPNELFAFFYCGADEITSRIATNDVRPGGGGLQFNLYNDSSHSARNKIVTQFNSANHTYDAFICTGSGWQELMSYIQTKPEWDVDGDGAPGGFSKVWDCDDNDPSVSPDLSSFGIARSVEICGDGRVNICQQNDWDHFGYSSDISFYTRFGVSDYVDLEGEDNCDLNPTACEESCLTSTGKCDYLAQMDEDGQVSEMGAGFCCGARQVDDVGNILTDPDTSNTNKLCAYVEETQNYMMGGTVPLNKDLCPEGSPWCWINPEVNGFNIFSIKELGKEPFDVVSNSNNWQICNGSTVGQNLVAPNFAVSELNFEQTQKDAHKFTCYDQGDRYVWAECVPDTQTDPSTNGIKSRVIGDGIYALPLDAGSTTIDLSEFNSGGDYYAQDTEFIQNIDFTGYDYLEFFVRFNTESPVPPVDVILKIFGEGQNEDEGYFNGPVLGYAINAPRISPDHWIQVQVPIGEWINVKQIQFSTTNPDANNIEIQFPQLTKDGEESKVCSGDETQDENFNSWVDSLDFSQSGINIKGDAACDARYGTLEKSAWFGGDLEVDNPESSCCGNVINEYYAGRTTFDDVPRGCWNGEVVVEGETAMNVEYSVGYQQTNYDVSFESVTLEHGTDYTIVESANVGTLTFNFDYQYLDQELTNVVDYSISPIVLRSYIINQNLMGLLFNDNIFPIDSATFTIEKNFEDPLIEVYFFDPNKQEKIGNYITFEKNVVEYPPEFTIQIVAETQKSSSTAVTLPPQTKTISTPCLDEECIYGLPGNPPYEITNNHPELYDMYFITGQTADEQTIITQTAQPFNEQGNLKVTKISQQVIYTQNEEGTYEFLGCNAADYIATDVDIALAANEGICTTTSSHYCAPQTNNNLINSWSDEPLTEFGYDVSGYQEGDELQKMDCTNPQNTDVDCTPNARNYSTSATPGRNILSNALFQEKVVNDITFWTLLDSTGHLVSDEYSLIDNEIFEIPSNSILKSEKIAVLPNEDYEFNQDSTCDITINVGNNAGLEEREESATFTTQETESYVQIIIEGECDFTHPSLHLVDDLNVAETEYNNDEPLRTGVSCCPDTMCWNGYTCTQDMAQHTFLSEKIGEVDYRCITGEWTYMGPKKDWKDDQFGFCSNNEQCFVASSLLGALSTNTAADFYEGQYPTCVDNGEYIFDHLCQDGEWISRTTNIVDTFVEFADTKDYVLYCSNYNDVFIDYNEPGYNLELQIAGQPATQTTAVLTDITGQPIEQPTNALCFPNINDPEIGQRLVPDRDNTCINNVCVLKYKDGSDFKTTFATSMNLPLDSPDSFLNTLGLTTADLATCTTAGVFSQCTNEVWYSPDIGALIYAKGGINLNPGFFSSVASWFVGLFTGSSASDVSEFLSNATNFNKLYVLNNNADNKQVRAISEPVNGEDVILAEYVGFETPVCEYVLKISEDKVLENRWPASPLYLVTCDGTSNDVYQVMAQTHPEFWWPQLTGALRSFTE